MNVATSLPARSVAPSRGGRLLAVLTARRRQLMTSVVGAAISATVIRALVRTYILTFSELAVVTSHTVTLRAPIDGQVSIAMDVGSRVDKEETIATIHDDRVDDSREVDLDSKVTATRQNIAALVEFTGELRELTRSFQSGADVYQKSRELQLTRLLSQGFDRVQGNRAILQEAASRVDRTDTLADSGLASRQEVDQAKKDKLVAEANLLASQESLEAARHSLNAAKTGINLDSDGTYTSNDKPYSRQRVDDLSIQLLARNRDLADQRAALRSLEGQLEGERRRLDLVRRADLLGPEGTRVLRVFVSTGEYVHKGQDILQVIDCGSGLVTAMVSERNFDRIRIGMRAHFELKNDNSSYDGEVIQVLGPLDQQSESTLSRLAISGTPAEGRYSALLRFPGFAARQRADCQIGQTGEVRFDTPAFAWSNHGR